jgi:hypothetical protein
MNSRELIARCENLTHRKLDYWCHNGVFDEDKVGLHRSGVRRTFSEDELQIAQVLAKVSAAFDTWSNGRGGLVALYREIARQIRTGTDVVDVEMLDGVSLVVRIDDPVGARPPLELVPEPELASEPVFIPGVGVDNG